MSYRIHPAAPRELEAAKSYYQRLRPELARGFLAEVDRAIAGIVELLLAYPQTEAGVRRYLVRRYPFGVY